MKNILLLILLTITSFSAISTTNKEMVGYLIYSKVAGGCEFTKQLGDWQHITQNSRSLSEKLTKYESARLGRKQSEDEELCQKGNLSHQRLLNIFKSDPDLAPVQEMFTNAYFNGYCGMIYISANIMKQDSEASLLLRFLDSEAVRMNFSSTNNMISSCPLSTEKYNKDIAELGFES